MWNNGLVPNLGRNMSKLYIVTQLIYLNAQYIMRNARLDEAQLKSRLPGEIPIISDMQMTPPL